MSTHFKHKDTKASMSRYCRHTHRTALICTADVERNEISNIAHSAKEIVNENIEKLSLMVPERLFAYASIDVAFSSESIRDNGELRFVIRDMGCEDYQDCLDDYECITGESSYLIEILLAPAHKTLASGTKEYYDARIIADNEAIVLSLCDTIMDSIMFSSYPELRAMSIEEKRDFSKNKWEFYQKHQLDSFYDIKYYKDIHYYSLAYSARTGYKTFHLEQYIQLWNRFLGEYYPDLLQSIPEVQKQLKLHVDFGHLPKDRIAAELSKDCYEERAYLLLTINRRLSRKSRPEILSIFGLEEESRKHFKLVRLCEYGHYKPYFYREELTVFKLIKPID